MPGVNVSGSVAGAIITSLIRFKDLQPKWIAVLARLLAAHDAAGLLRYQSDYRIDLLLRAMEDDAADQGQPTKEPEITFSLLAGDLKMALTRYWIFSTYEALRIAKNSEAGKANPKLQALYEQFRLVRIPLAKLEVANGPALKDGIKLAKVGPGDPDIQEYRSSAKIEYHPVVLFNVQTGSIGWIVIDGKTGKQVSIFRRSLSDQLLTFFD